MSATLIAEILGYLVAYGPSAVQVLNGIMDAYKTLTASGKVPTDDELKAMALGIMAAHSALPKPTV